MKQTAQFTEILAPAGGWDSLEAAVRCGATAVYLGGKTLNARRSAKGFDDHELAQAVTYCHVRGVKVYQTLNTVVFDSELPDLERAVETACAAGVDALIVQDLAVAALVRAKAPTMPLHASTQMAVHNAAGVEMLEELGFVRVVLAREMSREEIARVKAATSLELECFVHGALCFCVSGQCYLSSMIGGRSGNRGMCAQPCRLPFTVGGKSNALSLKDLSLIPQVEDMRAVGVHSLKIEGRMKRPEYVAAAVTACRQALLGEEPDYAALEAVFSRQGFTSGYYDGHPGREMLGTRRKEDVTSASGVLKGLASLYRGERQSVPVEFQLTLAGGQPATLVVSDGDGNIVTATGEPPQEALTAPTDPDKAAASLGKTGGTPYTVCNIQSNIDENVMVPASQLNALRRDALDQLTALREAPRPHAYSGEQIGGSAPYTAPAPPIIRVRLARAVQLTDALARQAKEIVLPAQEFGQLSDEQIKAYSAQLLVELPAILWEETYKLDKILQKVKDLGVAGAMVGNLGGIHIARRHGLAAHGDWGLNITNTVALEAYRELGLADCTVSFELELGKIRTLGGTLPRGMMAWGHLPLMVSRNCPVGECGSCRREFPTITDRLGNQFFVDCHWQVPCLYNHVPLYMADRQRELPAVDFLTLYFTRESPTHCLEILEQYRLGSKYDGDLTRGLYYRKVL